LLRLRPAISARPPLSSATALVATLGSISGAGLANAQAEADAAVKTKAKPTPLRIHRLTIVIMKNL
jgi:hypothetical protein